MHSLTFAKLALKLNSSSFFYSHSLMPQKQIAHIQKEFEDRLPWLLLTASAGVCLSAPLSEEQDGSDIIGGTLCIATST